MTNAQKRRYRKHYNKKILFYKSKESTDWRLWPKKFETNAKKEKSRRKKYLACRNLKRKQKEIKRRAKTHLENGDVRILVDLVVPPEAIAVLGKGLGFVPTPSQDIAELRLDARRTANKIVHFANKAEYSSEDAVPPSQTEDQLQSDPFSLPAKLRTANYYQAHIHSTDPEMTMAVQHLTTAANGFKLSKDKEKKTESVKTGTPRSAMVGN